jgi:hypothetical protein
VRLPEAAVQRLVTHGFIEHEQRRNEAAVAAAVDKLVVAWHEATARWDLSAVWPPTPSRYA